jgi:hexosaminidase
LEELGLTHEKNYGMMLRRLAAGQDISALKTLVDVVEPVKIYKRNHLRKQFTYTPLTRVVDAARPDAERAREFRNWTQEYLNNGNCRNEILQWLQIWKRNDSRLQNIIDQSPVLWEIRSLSKDLSAVALSGIVAMQFIETKKTAPEAWQKGALKTIERAKIPRGQVELMILPAIEELVKKASAK